ncbi:MAG TPA: extracellular solute-binding protein [Xanthomonadaceae bacterium]|nr:extracellular solute-binding protein [Xanthomonadaceae bacterium]
MKVALHADGKRMTSLGVNSIGAAAGATRRLVTLAGLAAVVIATNFAQAQDKWIVVASTTSTTDSGLFGHILPLFKQRTGIDVRVVSQGTGQALDTGRRGDADVVFVHAKAQEQKFVANGHGVKRHPVMYNDFILVGPRSDPAGISGSKDILAALRTIRAKGAPFISRGDKSGTHSAELALWKAAGIDPRAKPPPGAGERRLAAGPWYKEIGQGMGAALNTASAANAYVLTDRGSWLAFKNRGELVIAVEGDSRLFNQYGVVLVNPEKHKHVKKAEGQAFIAWLVSPEGEKAIAEYKIGGQQLFFPNANAPGA